MVDRGVEAKAGEAYNLQFFALGELREAVRGDAGAAEDLEVLKNSV